MVSMTFSQFVCRLMLSQTSSVSVVNERGLVAMRVWVKFTYQACKKIHTLNGWTWGIPKSTWYKIMVIHDDWMIWGYPHDLGNLYCFRNVTGSLVFEVWTRPKFFSKNLVEELTPKKPLLSDLQRVRIAKRSLQIKWSLWFFVYMQIYVFIFHIYIYMHEYDMIYYN